MPEVVALLAEITQHPAQDKPFDAQRGKLQKEKDRDHPTGVVHSVD